MGTIRASFQIIGKFPSLSDRLYIIHRGSASAALQFQMNSGEIWSLPAPLLQSIWCNAFRTSSSDSCIECRCAATPFLGGGKFVSGYSSEGDRKTLKKKLLKAEQISSPSVTVSPLYLTYFG